MASTKSRKRGVSWRLGAVVMVEVKAWKDGKAAAEAAAAIAAVTKGDPQKMVSEVEGAEIYEIAVARSLDFDAAAKIRELGLRGGRLLGGSTRVHPEGNLAAQLLGFVGQDNTGLTGLEADLESLVGGARGTVIFERDGLGTQLAPGRRHGRG